MFNIGSWPTIMQSEQESADSGLESANSGAESGLTDLDARVTLRSHHVVVLLYVEGEAQTEPRP